MKRIQRSLRFLLLLSFAALGTGLQAQLETTPIKGKQTVIIPKIDAYWSSVVIAENFPTFFPLELEVNLPTKNISFNGIFSPWGSRFSTQTQTTSSFSLISGFGFRYYFGSKDALKPGATGLFIEPQLFLRFESVNVQEIGGGTTNTIGFESAFMAAGGYQHAFWDRLYLQGRLSVGLGSSDILESYQLGPLLILPWVGVGIRLN